MLLLDAFCGAGGAGEGFRRAGFDVVGVDLVQQPRYPFEFHQDDALDVLRRLADGMAWHGITREDVGVIHASPPCQTDCAYRRKGRGVGDGYADLIAETRDLLVEVGLPYTIENVVGARRKLRDPIQLCGSSFGLDVQRHRLFESNVSLRSVPCDHSWQTPRFPAATNRESMSRRTVEIGVWRIPLSVQQDAMGINWMELRELSEAIPPAYTEFIGAQMMAALMQEAA